MLRTRLLLFFTLVASIVAATNSGIFADDGQVVQPPDTTLERRHARDFTSGSVEEQAKSNALRMRSGLPPLPPRQLWTKTSAALRPRTSSNCALLAADKSGQGYIAVRQASTGNFLGYVSKTFDGQNSYTFVSGTSVGNALVVQLPSTTVNSGTVFEFTAVNGPDSGHPLVGAVGGSGGYNFNPGQLGYAYLSGTGHTPANSPPSFSAGDSIQALGYNAPVESTIWSLDCSTLSLHAQWTNAGGSQPATSFMYDPSVDFLALVGDFNKFVQTFPGEGAYQVLLTFVPLP